MVHRRIGRVPRVQDGVALEGLTLGIEGVERRKPEMVCGRVDHRPTVLDIHPDHVGVVVGRSHASAGVHKDADEAVSLTGEGVDDGHSLFRQLGLRLLGRLESDIVRPEGCGRLPVRAGPLRRRSCVNLDREAVSKPRAVAIVEERRFKGDDLPERWHGRHRRCTDPVLTLNDAFAPSDEGRVLVKRCVQKRVVLREEFEFSHNG